MDTLADLLALLKITAAQNGISTPYIVGGIPRNILLDKNYSFKDIDITTGNPDVTLLSTLFAKALNKPEIIDGKHRKVIYGDFSFDFSTNFIYPNIEDSLIKKNFNANISMLEKETFSRDFTVNTLLLDLDMKKIFDLTNMGREDIEKGLIRCPLNCSKSFILQPIRILRAFKLKAKYSMIFDPEVRESIIKHAGMVNLINEDAVTKMMNSIYYANPDILDEMLEMGVLQKLPMTKGLTNILINKRKILDVLP